MDRDNLYVYGTIFLFVGVAWLLSSSLKVGITGFAADSQETEASVTVNDFISLTLQEGFPIGFGSLDPGTTNTSATATPANLTIGDETNVDFNITLNTTSDFVSDSTTYTFGIGNMSFWSTNITEQTNFTLNVEENAYYWQTCPCGSQANRSIWFYITVPAGQRAANDYKANITIGAVG